MALNRPGWTISSSLSRLAVGEFWPDQATSSTKLTLHILTCSAVKVLNLTALVQLHTEVVYYVFYPQGRSESSKSAHQEKDKPILAEGYDSV